MGWEFGNFSILHSKTSKNSPTLTIYYIEEALKEKEKPKEEEREKPKDAPGQECKPRPLHKTCSLFMRNIAPNISRAEIISVSGEKWHWGQGRQAPSLGRWGEDNLALLLIHIPIYRVGPFPWAHAFRGLVLVAPFAFKYCYC